MFIEELVGSFKNIDLVSYEVISINFMSHFITFVALTTLHYIESIYDKGMKTYILNSISLDDILHDKQIQMSKSIDTRLIFGKVY